jgi:uncharacterized protein (TIGR03437 family)
MHRINTFRTIFGLLLAVSAASAQQYTITTVAGIGTVQGWYGDTGPATSAQLNFPLRIAVDSKGNYYFADFLTQLIREVSGGTINTVVGTGAFGFQGDNGPGVQAIISDVHGLAVAPNGNVYFADTHNARVRELIPAGPITAPTGNVYTIAGNGTVGYTGDGGPATSAELSQPAGVAVDSSGNVYIADYGNYSVRKVDSKGNISTFAGTGVWGYSGDGGPANKAALAAPSALAFDSAGNLYISDLGNTNIRKITPDGNIQTVVSNISAPSIAVDAAGTIYYPDYVTSTVQKILANGTRFAIAGTGEPGFSGDNGPGTSAQLNQPYGVAVDSSGNVYVADSGNMVIRLLTPVASSVSVVNGASGVGSSISPGEIVTIYGTGLGPATGVSAQPGANGFGTQLAGTTVSFGGTLGPMLYASATQVNAIVPYNAPVGGTADVTVSYQGNSFTASAVPVASSAPGIFTLNSTGVGAAAVVNQNGTINGPNSPAPLGSIVSFYLTGEGQTNPAGVDGKIANTKPLPYPQQGVSATVSGQPTSVTYAGAAPGLVAGVMQANVVIPGTLVMNATGPVAVPVTVQVGSSFSQQNVTVYVTR